MSSYQQFNDTDLFPGQASGGFIMVNRSSYTDLCASKTGLSYLPRSSSVGCPLDVRWVSVGCPLDVCWMSVGCLLKEHLETSVGGIIRTIRMEQSSVSFIASPEI